MNHDYEDRHMADRNSTRRSDLILHSNEFAHIGDQTTGQIITYVGPMKTSLQNTEMPKLFDFEKKVFADVTNLDEAIQTMVTAPNGWYVTLKNPAPNEEVPKTGKSNDPIELQIGVKVNIPGPCNWPLWPGQMFKLVEGHRLRTNHYLMCRVYDAKAAMENWSDAVVEKQKEEASSQDTVPEGEEIESATVLSDVEEIPELSNGQRLIVKGTDVSFFIPPTGLEVVPEEIDEKGKPKYIRNALTLENLEYCILLDEDGNTRYVRGPQVVFPTPTERFLKDNDGNKKWRALELNEITGIYTKVIKEYKDDDTGEILRVGERFITGKNMKFYFPRAEEEIITYESSDGDKQDRHFAVAIPEGDGRYILDRGCREDGKYGGKVAIIDGPKMYLADPRYEVFVRRVLTANQCALWYPGNDEVMSYNAALKGITRTGDDFVSESAYQLLAAQTKSPFSQFHEPLPTKYSSRGVSGQRGDSGYVPEMATTMKMAKEVIPSAGVERKHKFTKPREIELDTKFQGVVSIDIWPGYAIQVVSKTNDRETVIGPITRKLEFSETLMPMEVSTGKPKTTDRLKKFVYLKIHANKISDIIEDVETSDLYKFDIKLSYRVNFLEEHEGVDYKERWFSVENYVKFLADNCRSRVKSLMKQFSIEDVYSNGYAMVRDIILGKQDEESGERPLLFFQENGMMIYDVEILTINIHDSELKEMLESMKKTVMKNNLKVRTAESNLAATIEVESVNRKINDQERQTFENNEENLRLRAAANMETVVHRIEMDIAKDKRLSDQKMADIVNEFAIHLKSAETRLEIEKVRRNDSLASQDALDKIHDRELARDRESMLQLLEKLQKEMEIRVQEAEKMADADAIKLRAINDKMIAAIEQLAASATFTSAADGLAPMSIVQGTSLVGAMGQLLEGTKLGETIKKLGPITEQVSHEE